MSYSSYRDNTDKTAPSHPLDLQGGGQWGPSLLAKERESETTPFHAFFLKETVQMTSRNQGGKQGMNPGASPGVKSERGFAAMDPERQRAIAREGGKAAHKSGHAHEFTSEEAREAGRKGGQASSKSASKGGKG